MRLTSLTQDANRVLKRAGLEVRRKPGVLIRSERELVMTTEFAVAHYLARRPSLTLKILQIGAFDGMTNDPIRSVIRDFSCQSVLVEPHPTHFGALKDLYDGDPSVTLLNVAIADHVGTQTLFTLKPDPGMPTWAPQVSSFRREHVERQVRIMPHSVAPPVIEAIEVETWTIEKVLHESELDGVDLLQVDTEGFDLEILKMFDIPRRLPAIVNYEHKHLSRRDMNAAADLLDGCGYRLAMSYGAGDTVAYLG